MADVRIEVRNAAGRRVSHTVIPRATEWFLPRQFEFREHNLYIEGSDGPLMPRWGRTVPPGGRLEIGAASVLEDERE
jgi:hypothetical protein